MPRQARRPNNYDVNSGVVAPIPGFYFNIAKSPPDLINILYEGATSQFRVLVRPSSIKDDMLEKYLSTDQPDGLPPAHPLLTKTLAELQTIIADDPLMAGVVRALLWPGQVTAPKGPPPPFPAIRDITAVQTAIFDNWPQGRKIKGKPCRFGCALEVWTAEADAIRVKGRRPNPGFKSNMVLMDQKNLKNQLREMRKPRRTPINSVHLDVLTGIADGLASDCLIGLIATRIVDDHSPYERGSYYHDCQFVCAYLDDAGLVESMRMITGNDDMLDLAPFDPLDAAGNSHGGNVILQSRHDLCGFSNTWATNRGS